MSNMNNELNRIKKLMNLNENRKFEYNCAMLYFVFPEMSEIHEAISKEDIYIDPKDDSFGLETEPHVTLLFGLHSNVGVDKIAPIISKYEFKNIVVDTISAFKTKDYDVLKFNAHGKSLYDCNNDLTKLPHTTNFPDYHPHMTIGYLKPGKSDKYIRMFKDKEYKLTPQEVVYSMTDGEKIKLNIKK